MHRSFVAVGVAAVLAASAACAEENSTMKVFHIPRLERARCDADSAAWGDTGLRVDVMPDRDGVVRPADQFDPRFRLAWNDAGLLLLLTVRDSVILEDPELDSLYRRDCIEIFMAAAPGAADAYQVMVAPGADPKFPDPRTCFAGRQPPVPLADLKITVARRKTADGYVAEILLPWSNLGRKGAKAGDRAALQVMVDDFGHGPFFNAIWFPVPGASRDSSLMYAIELADRADPPDGLGAWGGYEGVERARFGCVACAGSAGARFSIHGGAREYGAAALEARDGRAAAEIVLPMPAPGAPFPPLELRLGGRTLKTMTLQDADVLRLRQFLFEEFAFDAFCFQGHDFPRGDFRNPERIASLIGPYTLRFAYYDADSKPVTRAEKPGRYAAVVEIAHGAERPSRRFYTLYRLPDGALPREALLARAAIRFSARVPRPLRGTTKTAFGVTAKADPALLDVGEAILGRHAADLNDFATQSLLNALVREPIGAVLLAGLHDLAQTPDVAAGTQADSAAFAERKWWVGFKRKYYGTEKLFPRPFLPPQRFDGTPAPVLRAGAPAEAGMKDDAVGKLNAIGEEWAKTTGVGFNLAVARHGVIVLNRGFGVWEGEPVTSDTRCQLASATKFLSACLMLQAAHQGFVKLDGTVEQYIPAFRDVSVRRRMSVHELYDQTSGFPDHWNDEFNDMEELAADYYPLLEVGVKVTYQGIGHALGGKILEYLSGEPLPVVFQKYLFEPLECRASESAASAAGAISTASDLAKVGQMMLNGGAYGNLRFCSPELVRQLQSAPEKQRLGPDKGNRWGMGIKTYDRDGLSDQAFGHPGATGAVLFVDPKYDLVFSMARNDEGKDYLEWRHKLIAAILESCVR